MPSTPSCSWHLEADNAAIGVHPGDPDNMGPMLGGEVVVSGVGDFVLTIGVVDYDPCSFDEALDYMVATVPDFPAVAGGSLASFYTVDCLQLPTPAPQVVGTPLDILIPLELPAEFFVREEAAQRPRRPLRSARALSGSMPLGTGSLGPPSALRRRRTASISRLDSPLPMPRP